MKTAVDENLMISRIKSYEDFINLKSKGWEAEKKQLALENKITARIEMERKKTTTQSVQFSGYCYPSRNHSSFNLKYKTADDGHLKFNWRESLVSNSSKFNNRIRASVHLLDIECAGIQQPRIYIPEQVTRLYRYIQEKFTTVVGSEYLESEIPFGTTRSDGVRNEDLTNLSFGKNTFDVIFSLDIFEHIPNYSKAFEECFRILKKQGKLLFTVPFNYKLKHTIRAVLREDGVIEHILEPQYHGNPIDNEGVLCFQTFGWQLLEDLRNAGFDEAEAIVYWSDYYVYLGHWQLLFVAKKN